MDIRKAIHRRLKNTSPDELNTILKDSIHNQDETVLPGLGVLFEDYYTFLEPVRQREVCQQIANILK